jgi:hypothetical protein
VTVHRPPITEADGSITSIGEGLAAFVTLAERPARAAYVATMPVTCRLVAVVGTAYRTTGRVEVVRADGGRQRLPLRAAPGSWKYSGRMIGTFVHTTSRIVAVRAFDDRGHLARVIRILKIDGGLPGC